MLEVSMSCVLPGDYWMILSLQQMGEWLAPIMKFFTWFGYPQAYMIIIASIYWSFDRKLGLRMAIFLPVASILNSLLKQAFHAPRPYWMDPRIRAILVSNGFGMPSGHAQAATLWLYISSFLRCNWCWAVAIFTTVMVGLSRVYLGVHFFSQVLAGWFIGIILAILFIRYETNLISWLMGLKLRNQLLFITGLSFLFIVAGGIIAFFLRDWVMPLEWIRNASDDLAGKDEVIFSSISMAPLAGNTGGFMGAAMGAVLLHQKGGFDTRGKWWQRLVRIVTGLLLVFMIFWTFNTFSPAEHRDGLNAIWRFSGFFVITFSTIFLIPLLFMRLNLLSSTEGRTPHHENNGFPDSD